MMTPATSPTHSESANRTPRVSGRRFAIALASWCLAGIGVLSSFMVALATSASFAAALPLLAWVSLAVMTVRWVQDRRCHWFWPIFGAVSGLLSAAVFVWVFGVYVAAVPLATYLVWWHLKPLSPGAEMAEPGTPADRLRRPLS